ncbi:MAG: hypothetical protein RBS39_04210 [Phycisphaerales bacterium]|jgi:uncharacterized Zn finger protein|nr:hypothetical protein [Phycisphaerales bacterium]
MADVSSKQPPAASGEPVAKPAPPPARTRHVPPMAPPPKYVPPSTLSRRDPNYRSANPKRVRGGLRIRPREPGLPLAWAADRWTRYVEQRVDAEGRQAVLVEGMEYARAGQTRKLDLAPGVLDALVQGRAPRAYRTRIDFETLDADAWSRVIEAMAEGAIYAAKLLAGELPQNIEDLFAPLHTHLFPLNEGDARPSCDCDEASAQGGWCKHTCCAAALLADRLAEDPFLIFTLRGMAGEELLERLRQRRTASTATHGSAAPVYQPRIPGFDDVASGGELGLEGFWDAGPELEAVDTPLEPPPVSHPLLRRLGPSPFKDGRFPLVGLLATCYEVIGDDARNGAIPADGHEGDAPAMDDEDGAS